MYGEQGCMPVSAYACKYVTTGTSSFLVRLFAMSPTTQWIISFAAVATIL